MSATEPEQKPERATTPGPILVCGIGLIGFRVVELLHRLGERVIVVSEGGGDPWHRRARAAGIEMIEADVRDSAALEQAGISSATALLALGESDLVNIELALDARRAHGSLPIVVRLFDPILARQLEESFHLRRAIGMTTIAAPRFVAAAIGDDLIATFEVRGERFVIGQLEGGAEGAQAEDRESRRAIEAGATPIGAPKNRGTGRRLWTLLARREDWARIAPRPAARRVRAVRRRSLLERLRALWAGSSFLARWLLVGLALLAAVSVGVFKLFMGLSLVDAIYFVITTLTTTGYGDITPHEHGAALKLYASLMMIFGSAAVATIYSLITDFLVGARFRQLAGGRKPPERDHVVIAGLGNLGLRVAEELVGTGVAVAAIERDAESPYIAGVREQAAVLVGDARQPEILARVGIPGARAVVCTTGDDTVNLSIALAARRIDPSIRTVVRIFDPELAAKVEESFGIDAALGAARIAAPTFVASALERGVQQAFMLDDVLCSLCERLPDPAWIGRRPSELAQNGVAVVWREPGGRRSRSPAVDDAEIYDGERLLLALFRDAVRPALKAPPA